MAIAPIAMATADTIKIGEINHYKRMAAFAGPYKQGIELGLEEANASGGVLNKKIEFIFQIILRNSKNGANICCGLSIVLPL